MRSNGHIASPFHSARFISIFMSTKAFHERTSFFIYYTHSCNVCRSQFRFTVNPTGETLHIPIRIHSFTHTGFYRTRRTAPVLLGWFSIQVELLSILECRPMRPMPAASAVHHTSRCMYHTHTHPYSSTLAQTPTLAAANALQLPAPPLPRVPPPRSARDAPLPPVPQNARGEDPPARRSLPRQPPRLPSESSR